MTAITAQGYSITSLSDRFAALVALAQGIWGPSINVDANSYDGQHLGIFAEAINDLDQLGQSIFNSFNPNTASGNALSLLVQLNYLKRNSGAYSTVSLHILGTPGAPIPAGSLFQSSDGSNNLWALQSDTTIDNTGQVTAQAQALVFGPLTASIGVITKVLSPNGIDSCSNPTAATPGAIEETDEQLRIRRAGSTAANGQGPVDALRGALLEVAGVTACQVYENFTDSTNSNGQTKRSIYAVVVGGANQSIWDTIWFKRSAGVTPLGSTTGAVYDTAGFPHTMAFDRPTQTPIYIIANVKQRTGFPANGAALIKAALVAWALANQTIGQGVVQSELYAPIMSSVNNTGSILTLFIGLAASPTLAVDLTIAYNAIAEFDPSFITVNLS